MKKKLYELAHCRAGDKGNTLILSLICYNERDFPLLREKVTVTKVKQHFRKIVAGDVIRYELPHIAALQFVCHNALSGGVTTSLAMDSHGKSLSSLLLEMEIELTQ